ncbi:hypothetical protein [Empedobacter brevis]|uniref:hypothetical protein n=1 Tax=Empedobacter brevis TaxID=247 RepID=UPI0039B0FBBC
MAQFTGTIEDFMNTHEEFINDLILKKINKQVVLDIEEVKDIHQNELIQQKLDDLKEHIADLFENEFGDWEITMDLESFEQEFEQHFHISKQELDDHVLLK